LCSVNCGIRDDVYGREIKVPLERSGSRWENNIEINVKEIDWEVVG
jgi:hypothetical protein